MKRSSVIDFFGVLQRTGYAITVVGLAAMVLGVLILWTGPQSARYGLLVSTPGIVLLMAGVALASIAMVSRRFIASMLFLSDQ